jgi:hypothetical protein
MALGMIGVNSVPAASSLVSTGTFAVPYEMSGELVPLWSNGALVVVRGEGAGAPSIFAVDRQGRQVFAATLLIPDSIRTYVLNMDRGTDGTVAVCGSAWSSDGRGAPYIARFSPDGLTEQVIRTESYYPYLVALAPDGTVWAEGFEMINWSSKGANANAFTSWIGSTALGY